MKNFKKNVSLITLSAIVALSIVNPVKASWYDDAINFINNEKIELTNEVTKEDVSKQLGKILEIEQKENSKEQITREELSDYIVKSLEKKGYILNNNEEIIKNVADYSEIKKEYRESFAKAYNLNILVGDGIKLNPNEKLSKNEFAQVLKNISNLKYLEGKVTEISKYGNITVSIEQEAVKKSKIEQGDILTIIAKDKFISAPFGDTYSNVDNKKEIVIPSKEGNLIIAINMGNFAEKYDLKKGDTIKIMLQGKKLYLEEYKIRNIDKNRTYNRDDYKTDEIYANFREIKVGKIAPKTLYRTSSPINPKLKRASYADKLIEKANVKTVINLADSKEDLQKYIEAEEFNSPYYKTLIENNKVIALNMGVDFASEDFTTKLKEGLEFFAKGEAPYVVHCTEGKDRAGFVSIVLEMLADATVDEIKEDYMESYINYFHVEKNSEQYEKIAKSNVLKTLMTITKTENLEELKNKDLRKSAEEYLKETVKLDENTIKTIEEIIENTIEMDKVA